MIRLARNESFWGRQELLSARDVAQRLGLSVRTVWRWSMIGHLPPPVRMGTGGRTVRWKAAEIERFVQCMKPRLRP
jgi:predicted DNA-binding transcriptional regulator AlpA